MNQIRYKIGVMFGDPTTTPGGLALKFHSSMRLKISSLSTIKKGEVPVGNHIKVTVVKNKLAPPFKCAELDIIYGKGILRESEILELGCQHNLIEKSGAWLSYKGEKIGQGRENAIEFLSQHPDIVSAIENELRTILGLSH